MNATQIAEHYWVSPQLEIEEITEAAEAGFEVIICNRPDNEGPDQPTSTDIEAKAQALGLSFFYLPMQGPVFTQAYVDQVKQLIAEEKKVLAYCRSGNRSSVLFNAALA